MVIRAKEYDIVIERGAINRSGELASAAVGSGRRAVVVSDDNVYPLYGRILEASLKDAGFEMCDAFVFPHGEQSKNMTTLDRLLCYLGEKGITRTDVIFALGGGVVGDLAGFAAAVYLRGIRFIQLPTTVIAMTDSSVGGKTAVDLASGKNLAGAFHNPSLVICDIDTLGTLPELYFSDGMAEVIKYGYIGDSSLLSAITAADAHLIMDDVVAMCVADKIAVVSEDLYDNGVRQKLNLGHTIGHAIEAVSGYTIPHGHAVAVGMAMITRAAERRGICTAGTADNMSALLDKYALSDTVPECGEYTAEKLYAAALHDKKKRGGKITLVIPTVGGSSELFEYPVEELYNVIRDGMTK